MNRMPKQHDTATVEDPQGSRALSARGRHRQDLIVRIAADIIAGHGIERATFREIATRAGVSKGVVEHHFRDKADIVRKTLAWLNQCALEREQRAVLGKSGLEALRARLLSLLPTKPALVREWKIRVHYWSVSFTNQDEKIGMSLRITGARERFEQDLRDAIAAGEVPRGIEVEGSARMLLHVLAGVACNHLVDPRHFGRAYQLALVDKLLAQLRRAAL